MSSFFRFIVGSLSFIFINDLSSYKKSEILCKIAEIDQNLIKGCNEYIQFMNMIYFIIITM